MDYNEFYHNNGDFQRYVNHYCDTYNMTVEDALERRLVQEVANEYYKGVNSHGGKYQNLSDMQ